MKMYIVRNEKAGECVGFDDRDDAEYAATGDLPPDSFDASALAEAWRDVYGDDGEQYPIEEVDI